MSDLDDEVYIASRVSENKLTSDEPTVVPKEEGHTNSQLGPEFRKLIELDNTASAAIDDAIFEACNEASAAGHRFFPTAWILQETEFYRAHQDDLRRFSDLIEKYFTPEPTRYDYSDGRDDGRAGELIKLIASVLFSRVMRRSGLLDQPCKPEKILNIRQQNPALKKLFSGPHQPIEYKLIIANLRLASAFLGVGSYQNGILNLDELSPNFFSNITGEFCETAYCGCCSTCFTNLQMPFFFLPSKVIQASLAKISTEDCFLFPDKIMIHVQKGYWVDDNSDEIYEALDDYFQAKYDFKEIAENFRRYASENIASWLIPLQGLGALRHLTGFSLFDTFHDEEMINYALTLADRSDDRSTALLPREWTGVSDQGGLSPYEEEFDILSHWALHAIFFSSSAIVYEPSRWFKFSAALDSDNQPYYACLVLGVFFQHQIILAQLKYEKEIDLNLATKVLKRLSVYPSFSIVQDSFSQYLDYSEDSEKYYGSFASFTVKKFKKVPPLTVLPEGRSRFYEKSFSNFSEGSIDDLKKVFGLIEATRDQTIYIYRESAFNLLRVAIEAEFRVRTRPYFSRTMINELSSKIHFTAKSHETMYLGSYHFLLKKFQEVEKTLASAVKPLWKISKHSQFDKFIEEFNWLNRKVNEYSHAPKSGQRDRLDQDISEVFELLTKGVFLAVLNDTA